MNNDPLHWTLIRRWTVIHHVQNGPDVEGELERLWCPAGHREVVIAGHRPAYCIQCDPDRWLGR